MLAFVLLLVGVLVLSLQDVLVKQTAADTSFWQLQTVRSTFNLTMIVLLAVASFILNRRQFPPSVEG